MSVIGGYERGNPWRWLLIQVEASVDCSYGPDCNHVPQLREAIAALPSTNELWPPAAPVPQGDE